MKNNGGSSKLDRKTVEKNRRIHMKGLCFKLSSLIPSHYFNHSKEMLSQQDQLYHAELYIKQLKEKIEKLKEMKEQAMGVEKGSTNNAHVIDNTTIMSGLKLPFIELRELGSSLEVILISGLKKNFMLYEVISVLEEEGAEVVVASFAIVGDKVFHTLHAQAKVSRVGVDTTSVWQRLQELTY